MKRYVGNKEACEIIGIHYKSLYNWDKSGKIEVIRTPGNKRLYNIEKFINDNKKKDTLEIKFNINTDENIKTTSRQIRRNICYCRVSTNGQKNDLERQIQHMKENFPNYEIIKDIGSGLNFKRKGLLKIIDLILKNEVQTIVVAYKDRLCRFGYELIEYILKEHSKGEIVILNKIETSPEEEMTKDLVTIINVFSARINGLRKYKNNVVNIINDIKK